VFKVEDYMVRSHLERYPNDVRRSYVEEPGGFRHLVDRPKGYLRKLWKVAAANAVEDVRRANGIVFLLMHTAFYHNGSEEFFTCVAPDVLATMYEKGATPRIITLIDDCYDTFSRLCGVGQVWDYPDPEQTTDFGIVADAVAKIGLVLDWRAAEVSWAEQLATALCADHFLVAVKHPVSVVADLARSSKRPIYISHPITAVRDLLARNHRAEAEVIIGEINDLTSLLRESDSVVPFSPTTIDEFRLVPGPDQGYRTGLGDRWPIGNSHDLLFVPPTNPIAAPLTPPRGAVPADDPMTSAYSGILAILAKRIKSQINWRDRKLVEQSQGLVVYRPYYRGRMSFGVLEEVRQRNTLVEHHVVPNGGSPCVVLNPRQDLALWRPEFIAGQLRDEATRDDGAELTAEDRTAIQMALQQDTAFVDVLQSDGLDATRLRQAVEAVVRVRFRGNPAFRGPLDGVKRTAYEAWGADKWREIAGNVNAADWVGAEVTQGDTYLRDLIPVAEFAGIAEGVFRT
jgi:hypothetical protein